MKKDINMFEAYKVGNTKLGGKGNGGIILLIVLFVFIIAGAYGALHLYQMKLEQQTNDINKILDNPDFAQDRIELENLKDKSQLLALYKKALEQASDNYKKTITINEERIKAISAATPNSVKFKSMRITPENIQLECTGANPLDPAIMTQALSLNTKKLFDNVMYQGITREPGGPADIYYFTITCNFKENEK